LKGTPYCSNWYAVAFENAKPENIHWLYKRGGDAKSRASGSVKDDLTIMGDSNLTELQ
jgi:hypothetical protein